MLTIPLNNARPPSLLFPRARSFDAERDRRREEAADAGLEAGEAAQAPA
jgi:hypothetical protein